MPSSSSLSPATSATGQGWALTGLIRYKHYRDFGSAFSFLGSYGPLMRCVQYLSADSSCLYEFPTARLPAAQFGQQRQQQQQQQSILVGPFEYYMLHFASLLVSQKEDPWFGHHQLQQQQQQISVDNESLYPILFEDYLSEFLPMGGGNLVRSHGGNASPSPQPAYFSPQQKQQSKLFRNDIEIHQTLQQTAAHQTMSSSPTCSSPETMPTAVFVDVVTKFWVSTFCGAGGNSPSRQQQQPVSMPSGDLVKMVRMFIKHVHYFFNSFHPARHEVRETLKQGIFGDFFALLRPFFEHLFAHWPLDASFRLVLETWLSYIQPWRYRDPTAADKEAGQFQPEVWSNFITAHADFYDGLFRKVVLRFLRLDLSCSKNAFMLYRMCKVFGQDGLAPALKAALSHRRRILPAGGTPRRQMHVAFVKDQERTKAEDESNSSVFDEEFEPVLSDLVVRVNEARRSLQEQAAAAAGPTQRKHANILTTILVYILHTPDDEYAGSSEAEEHEKTRQNLGFVSQKLTEMFSLTVDIERIYSSPMGGAGSAHARSSRLHDESSPLTPQMRWDIINRAARYSPRFHGNPDETPLRTDEFHFLARSLYRLSLWINGRFPVASAHGAEGAVGAALRLVCHPAETYTTLGKHGVSSEHRLPPRVMLRPMAGHKAVAYAVFLALFAWLFGTRAFLKVGFVAFVFWMTKVALTSLMGGQSEARTAEEEEDKTRSPDESLNMST